MTTQTQNWPATEAAGQSNETASRINHHVSPVVRAYPITDWRTWPEVEITIDPALAELGPCERCGWLDRPIAYRVHFHDEIPQDVCAACVARTVQDAVTWSPDNYLTQVETAS
jgi:hypothetical protein